jgi:OmpA-OmpF porin, OOP family
LITGVIEGHTDSNGSAEYNQDLSERRAKAVREYLVSKGVAGSRLTAEGVGETRPIADNTNAEGRAQNRRVVLRRTDQT